MEKIAQHLHTRLARVSKWRQRFAAGRLSGLSDAARPGKPHTYTEETERRVLRLLDQSPPEGYAKWNGPLLAEALGDVSADHVWRILRKHQIQLQRRRSWCISTDPEFGPKAADVVGLYLNPPENALVLSVDEKPHIQALERAQGFLLGVLIATAGDVFRTPEGCRRRVGIAAGCIRKRKESVPSCVRRGKPPARDPG